MFDGACLAVRTATEQKGRVSRSCITDDLCIEISVQIGCSDEVLFEFSAKSLVQANEHAFRILSVGCLRGKSDLQHGSDERGRDAVTGDVGDENAELIACERKEIVEIAGDGAHGQITRGYFDSGQPRNFTRQDGCLNLLGDFKFFLNREKALLLGENAVSNEVTQAEYKGEKPYWFDVASTKHAKANEISVKNEEPVNDKAHGHDAEFEREAARRAEDK